MKRMEQKTHLHPISTKQQTTRRHYNILKAAQNYGLNAKGLKVPLEKVKAISPPYIFFGILIIFWLLKGWGTSESILMTPAQVAGVSRLMSLTKDIQV
jgi:ABC-type bacteriocin/lantibiotic exporter with double-glycine peptidase domain